MSPEKSRDGPKIGIQTAEILARGEPDRVLINKDGAAVSMRRAIEMNVVADLIFVRDDGWMLGCPGHLEEVASNLWKDHWLLVYHVASDTSLPAAFYMVTGLKSF